MLSMILNKNMKGTIIKCACSLNVLDDRSHGILKHMETSDKMGINREILPYFSGCQDRDYIAIVLEKYFESLLDSMLKLCRHIMENAKKKFCSSACFTVTTTSRTRQLMIQSCFSLQNNICKKALNSGTTPGIQTKN